MWDNFDRVKIRIFVPEEAADKIRLVLGETGAGRLGNYEFCSCTYKSEGRFRPLGGAHPAVGKIGGLEVVNEVVVEVDCDKDLVKKVLENVKRVHPYEEPAIDVIPLLKI